MPWTRHSPRRAAGLAVGHRRRTLGGEEPGVPCLAARAAPASFSTAPAGGTATGRRSRWEPWLSVNNRAPPSPLTAEAPEQLARLVRDSTQTQVLTPEVHAFLEADGAAVSLSTDALLHQPGLEAARARNQGVG